MQLPSVSDDSAHDPRHVGVRHGSGLGAEEEGGQVLSMRPDLAALRGRDDSARDMPVLLLHQFQMIMMILVNATTVI